jgi:hypothetical protein
MGDPAMRPATCRSRSTWLFRLAWHFHLTRRSRLAWRSRLATLVALATVAPLVWSASATASTGTSTGGRTFRIVMCAPHQHLIVDHRYFVRNEVFGSPGQCLINHNRWANFQVTVSKASTGGPESLAYPDIYYGCLRGLCSPGTTLPARVYALKSPEASWYTRDRASGRWNTAFDVWFSRKPQTAGQHNGTEMMIWLNESDFRIPTYDHGRYVRIEGARWYFDHWRTCQQGTCWNYVRFWRVPSTWHVRHLWLNPFIKTAERAHLINRSWWLEAIAAGYELWRGGQGLTTTWFSTRA